MQPTVSAPDPRRTARRSPSSASAISSARIAGSGTRPTASVVAKYAGNNQVRFVFKHFPLEGECNTNAPNGNHFAACEAAAAVVMARANGKAEQMTDWLYAEPDDADAGLRARSGQVRRRDRRLQRRLRAGARGSKGRRQSRRPARRDLHADLLHQRPQAAGGRHPGQLHGRAHRRWSCSARSNATCPPMPPAIRIEELTKDYPIGFWRAAPVPRARSADARHRAGRGLRLPRSERRRQDHHAEAAHAADLSDLRARRDSRAAGRRRRGAAAHRLPSGEPVLLRLPHRAKSCSNYFGQLFGYSRRRSRASASPRCSIASGSAPSAACSCGSSRRA